ncbi:hypothetical protein B4168_0281 [Anoxybacillus flavithermus]|nr:hypothetical protein B4168_0281 [Anoxybacillus flavithermus]OAO88805.1 hypothetical protein GT23_0045 [Parageobacillus thermoglucosidasius]
MGFDLDQHGWLVHISTWQRAKCTLFAIFLTKFICSTNQENLFLLVQIL